ncbi:MAG: hypothetical protein Q8M92_02990, partial [Candidatus Subteraquimicrobiales bacterium]|nr:hypothetical protein [Candidatus Subteraquimicrobiales bacterium]
MKLIFERFVLSFYYYGRHREILLSIEQAVEIAEAEKLNSVIITCPDMGCEYYDILKEGENCPKCGKPSKIISFIDFKSLKKDKIKIFDY